MKNTGKRTKNVHKKVRNRLIKGMFEEYKEMGLTDQDAYSLISEALKTERKISPEGVRQALRKGGAE